MYLTLNEFPEGFFLTEDFQVGGVGFDFNQQFSFVAFTEFVVEIHRDFLNEFLVILISHCDTFFTVR